MGRGEGSQWDWAGLGVGGGWLPSGSGLHSGVGEGKKGDLLAWGRRGGMGSSGHGASPCREEFNHAKLAFLLRGETSRLDSSGPLLPRETARRGPTLSPRVGAVQLRQADKGRTILDLKNARNYLP